MSQVFTILIFQCFHMFCPKANHPKSIFHSFSLIVSLLSRWSGLNQIKQLLSDVFAHILSAAWRPLGLEVFSQRTHPGHHRVTRVGRAAWSAGPSPEVTSLVPPLLGLPLPHYQSHPATQQHTVCDICKNLSYGETNTVSHGQMLRVMRGFWPGPTIFVTVEHLEWTFMSLPVQFQPWISSQTCENSWSGRSLFAPP